MELLTFWFVCGVVTGIVAASRGRHGFGWFLLGVLFGPFALILVALLPSQTPAATAARSNVTYVGGELATPETHVRCPDCKGFVHKEAVRCMHCGCALVPASKRPKPGPQGLAALAESGFTARPLPDETANRRSV